MVNNLDSLDGYVRGARHNRWAGVNVGYHGLHYRVIKKYGKPYFCFNCFSKKRQRYQWANISELYLHDISDWTRLCPKCHSAFDGNGAKCGEENLAAKLTYEKANLIKRLYAVGNTSQRKLAFQFGVSRTCVVLILKGETWKNL